MPGGLFDSGWTDLGFASRHPKHNHPEPYTLNPLPNLLWAPGGARASTKAAAGAKAAGSARGHSGAAPVAPRLPFSGSRAWGLGFKFRVLGLGLEDLSFVLLFLGLCPRYVGLHSDFDYIWYGSPSHPC